MLKSICLAFVMSTFALNPAGAQSARDYFGSALTCRSMEDLECAEVNARKAAELGLAEAEFQLGGWATLQGRQPEEAVRWWRRAAEKGHTQAQRNMGIAYDQGYGVTEDPREAARWYRAASSQGDTPSMLNLGILLSSGKLGAPDPTGAFRWIHRAAEADDPLAQENLAMLYGRGEGTEYDPANAYKWIRIARLQIETNDYMFGVIKGLNSRSARERIDQKVEAWQREADRRHGADYSANKLSPYQYKNVFAGEIALFVPDAFLRKRKGGGDHLTLWRPQYHGFHTFFISVGWHKVSAELDRAQPAELLSSLAENYARASGATVITDLRNFREWDGRPVLPLDPNLLCQASRTELSVPRVAQWNFPFLTRAAHMWCVVNAERWQGQYFVVSVSERFAPSKGVDRYPDFDDLTLRVFSSVTTRR